MTIKYGNWSETRLYQYNDQQNNLNILSHKMLVAANEQFTITGNYFAPTGSKKLEYYFANLAPHAISNFTPETTSEDWSLTTDVPQDLDAGFQTSTIVLESRNGEITSKKVGFWFKQIEIILVNGEDTRPVDNFMSNFFHRGGMHIGLMGMSFMKWKTFLAAGLKLFIAYDYNKENNTGTWQEISTSTMRTRQSLFKQYKKLQIAIKLIIPLPLPNNTAFELSGFAYMLD